MKNTNKPSEMEEEFYRQRWLGQEKEFLVSRKLIRVATILNEIADLNRSFDQILEVGCGRGQLSSMLAEIGNVTAFDISADVIERAKETYPSINFLTGSIPTVTLPHRNYDLLVCQEVFEHLQNQSEFIEFSYDVLKPDGLLIMTTPNARAFHASGAWEAYKKSGSMQPVENLVTIGELKGQLKRKFDIVSIKTVVNKGKKGLFRYYNAPKLRKYAIWRNLTDALFTGLHTIVVAKPRKV